MSLKHKFNVTKLTLNASFVEQEKLESGTLLSSVFIRDAAGYGQLNLICDYCEKSGIKYEFKQRGNDLFWVFSIPLPHETETWKLATIISTCSAALIIIIIVIICCVRKARQKDQKGVSNDPLLTYKEEI